MKKILKKLFCFHVWEVRDKLWDKMMNQSTGEVSKQVRSISYVCKKCGDMKILS